MTRARAEPKPAQQDKRPAIARLHLTIEGNASGTQPRQDTSFARVLPAATDVASVHAVLLARLGTDVPYSLAYSLPGDTRPLELKDEDDYAAYSAIVSEMRPSFIDFSVTLPHGHAQCIARPAEDGTTNIAPRSSSAPARYQESGSSTIRRDNARTPTLIENNASWRPPRSTSVSNTVPGVENDEASLGNESSMQPSTVVPLRRSKRKLSSVDSNRGSPDDTRNEQQVSKRSRVNPNSEPIRQTRAIKSTRTKTRDESWRKAYTQARRFLTSHHLRAFSRTPPSEPVRTLLQGFSDIHHDGPTNILSPKMEASLHAARKVLERWPRGSSSSGKAKPVEVSQHRQRQTRTRRLRRDGASVPSRKMGKRIQITPQTACTRTLRSTSDPTLTCQENGSATRKRNSTRSVLTGADNIRKNSMLHKRRVIQLAKVQEVLRSLGDGSSTLHYNSKSSIAPILEKINRWTMELSTAKQLELAGHLRSALQADREYATFGPRRKKKPEQEWWLELARAALAAVQPNDPSGHQFFRPGNPQSQREGAGDDCGPKLAVGTGTSSPGDQADQKQDRPSPGQPEPILISHSSSEPRSDSSISSSDIDSDPEPRSRSDTGTGTEGTDSDSGLDTDDSSLLRTGSSSSLSTLSDMGQNSPLNDGATQPSYEPASCPQNPQLPQPDQESSTEYLNGSGEPVHDIPNQIVVSEQRNASSAGYASGVLTVASRASNFIRRMGAFSPSSTSKEVSPAAGREPDAHVPAHDHSIDRIASDCANEASAEASPSPTGIPRAPPIRVKKERIEDQTILRPAHARA